jgi:hypothetical protein
MLSHVSGRFSASSTACPIIINAGLGQIYDALQTSASVSMSIYKVKFFAVLSSTPPN